MERGIVKSYDKACGTGSIGRSADADVNFTSSNVLGRSRADLKQGDQVWFEIDHIQSLNVAINIRKA